MVALLLTNQGTIKARGYDTQISDSDPTAHAEINAMRKLGKQIGSRYLGNFIIFANASSCSSCMSEAVKAHITEFYFGAPPEPTMNPWLPMVHVAAKSKNKVEIHGPINGTECTEQIASDRKNI